MGDGEIKSVACCQRKKIMKLSSWIWNVCMKDECQ